MTLASVDFSPLPLLIWAAGAGAILLVLLTTVRTIHGEEGYAYSTWWICQLKRD